MSSIENNPEAENKIELITAETRKKVTGVFTLQDLGLEDYTWLEQQESLSSQDVLRLLFRRSDEIKVQDIIDLLPKMNLECQTQVALHFCDESDESLECLVNNLDVFDEEALNKQVALKLIEKGQASAVAWGSDYFFGLDEEIADKLRNLGHGQRVDECITNFQN